MTVIELNQSQFHSLVDSGDSPVLVEFQAPWCVYCRRISPALAKVAQQRGDTLVVAQVNIDDEPQLALREQIEVVPTLVLYRNGKALGSIVAPESKTSIDRFIEEALAN